MFDIFNNDAFSVTSLTDAMREVAYVPSFVSSLGIFQEESIDTLSIAIEKDADDTYSVVPSSPRGGPGDTVGKGRRSLRNLTVPHFQRDDAINADEVQGVRAFGTEEQVELFQGKIARRASTHSQSFALTEEYHRLSVVTQGKLLDADGTVLFNYFTEMGESQPAEVDWELDAASPADGDLRQKSANLMRVMGAALGGLPFNGILALAGNDFYDGLMKHKNYLDTYKGYEGVRELRNGFLPANNPQGGAWGVVEAFNITWANYRGGLGVDIGADEVKFIPLGVPGLFKTVYAPADYIETVNRPGQRLYAKQWVKENGKGVALEFQTNALHYCTRPRVLQRGRRT
ncbi:major capsid protein [Bosea sp. (in: a-proteobacteria)]|uniref:major capsid protein n=1 Tax=Bosea sp. (in: a-proteobacteria) TaxID=1871050 RepID=UPI001ACEEFE9|nr:major capsid protein [Bosea sp. (in: a-proteobacteria)]MBN9444376.1 major capsid protein [Bosea sp. (in: a-proteobacteria)]